MVAQNTQRRTPAIRAVFLCPLHGFLWAAVQDAFGRAGFLCGRSTNLHGLSTLLVEGERRKTLHKGNTMSKSQSVSADALPKPYFDAAFTLEQVESIESNYNARWCFKRRLMMAILSRSSQELLDGFPELAKNNGEAYFEVIDQLEDYLDHLKSAVQLAESSLNRLVFVGEYLTQKTGSILRENEVKKGEER